MTSPSMRERGAAYERFRKHLDSRGRAGLHSNERELLMEAANALLFDEDAATEQLARALETLRSLAASDRWDDERIELMSRELRACGAPAPAAVA